MADTTMNRSPSEDAAQPRFTQEAILSWLTDNRQAVVLMAIMALAAVLRIYDVGAKALHHDESLHAQFTYQLYNGQGYVHDPLMHGPFLYHAGSVIFFLFGDNDFTGRLLPAIFGVALVGMPYFLRKQLGWTAVLIAALLITISPTLMYVSRFFRHDPYVIVFVFAMVICIWRYLDEQKPRYLYGFALFLGLAFATMEITYIYAAIMLVYVNLMLAWELSGRPEGQEDERNLRERLLQAVAIAPIAWLIAAIWPFLGKRPFGRERLPLIGDVMIVLGTLSATQFGPAIEVLPFVGDHGYNVPEERGLRNITVTTLLVGAAYVGLMWKPKVYAVVAAAFFVPYVLLFTTFFTNIDGFFSGIWGSLDYWLAQQDVRRGDQPNYYYALLTPLYEFLPLLIAVPGAVWLAWKGNSLTRFLLFWLVGIAIGLSIAGEKMPWLELHIALPLILCASVILARILDSFALDMKQGRVTAGVMLVVALGVLLLVEGTTRGHTVGGAILIGLALGWAAGYVVKFRQHGISRGFGVVLMAVLMVLTIRAAYYVSFVNYDTPVEMLVYTQTSPEIPQLTDRIDHLARESGLGHNLPIVVDQTDGFAWPWAWYLRHYKSVSYVNGVSNLAPQEGTVLIIHAGNAGQIDAGGYAQVPFKHRWWFNETYRDLKWGDVLDTVTSVDRLKGLGDFFLHRRPVEGNTGSVDSVLFFPESLAAFDLPQPAGDAPPPETLQDGRIVFGRTGMGPGQMLQAANVFVDQTGTIWVADARSNRIHRFDSQGVYLGSLGRSGSEPGALNQPWSLTVDDQGFIYVADTWNHRIQKFSPEMQYVQAWGGPTADPEPGPLHLYGPRDIVVDVDGTLWVTDTGHKRLMNYATDGTPLGSIGTEGSGLGQFAEPVGLAIDSQGRLLVADAWNGRIQAIVDAGTITSFPVGWASQAVADKPYIAVLTDGRVVATDPARGEILLFAADGTRIGAWTPQPGGLPIGIDATSDGGFVFSDGHRNEVQIVPPSTFDSLFR